MTTELLIEKNYTIIEAARIYGWKYDMVYRHFRHHPRSWCGTYRSASSDQSAFTKSQRAFCWTSTGSSRA
jgi:hypothetical protein